MIRALSSRAASIALTSLMKKHGKDCGKMMGCMAGRYWMNIQAATQMTDAVNVTYSGGQASKGQGGFYGSGGSRASLTKEHPQRPELLAIASDVERVTFVMNELDVLESLMDRDSEENGGSVTNHSIELRGKMKHLMTEQSFLESLERLEVMGAPIWGLSCDERRMVEMARCKVDEC